MKTICIHAHPADLCGTCNPPAKKESHEAKLRRFDELLAELDALAADVEAYERERFPVPPPTLGESLEFRREQMGETVEEIAARAGITPRRWMQLALGDEVQSLDEARKLYAVGIPARPIFQPNPNQ
jgi:hypothetical protein